MMKTDLRAKLAAAEAKLEAAHGKYNRLMAVQQDAGARTDDILALQQAIMMQTAALAEYGDLLRQFADLVCRANSV